MRTAIEQRYLNVAGAARYLGLSEKTIYCWAERRRIPAYKVGRVWRFDKTELDDFVRGNISREGFIYNPLECSGPEREGV